MAANAQTPAQLQYQKLEADIKAKEHEIADKQAYLLQWENFRNAGYKTTLDPAKTSSKDREEARQQYILETNRDPEDDHAAMEIKFLNAQAELEAMINSTELQSWRNSLQWMVENPGVPIPEPEPQADPEHWNTGPEEQSQSG